MVRDLPIRSLDLNLAQQLSAHEAAATSANLTSLSYRNRRRYCAGCWRFHFAVVGTAVANAQTLLILLLRLLYCFLHARTSATVVIIPPF